MSKLEKVIERLKARPPQADFGDLAKVLESEGWTLDRQKGSHVAFTKPGERSITFPLISGRKVKVVYIDQVLDKLGL